MIMNNQIVLTSLILTGTAYGNCAPHFCDVTTFIQPRSQASSLALQYVGWQQFLDAPEQPNDVVTAAGVVVTSFRPERLAQCLFGETILDCSQALRISGSQTERAPHDWLADYFGLPTDYESTVHLNPHMHSALIDLNGYYNLSRLYPHLFAMIRIPIEYTWWSLRAHEKIETHGSLAATAGYYSDTSIARQQLSSTFSHYMNGTTTVTAAGLTYEPLRAAKIACHTQHQCAVPEVRLYVGYRFLECPMYHGDIALLGVLGTGTRPQGNYLFEPLVGNGHHNELGIQATGHYTFFGNQDSAQELSVHAGFWVTHLFATDQCRFFDLNCKQLSRYQLAARYTTDITNNLNAQVAGGSIPPHAQYAYHLAPVANLTQGTVTVSYTAACNVTAFLSYRHNCNEYIMGYQFWGRTQDQLRNVRNTRLQTTSGWALKGDAYVVGFAQNAENTPIALSATQSYALLTRGNNTGNGVTTPTTVAASMTNPHIDNPYPAAGDTPLVPLATTPGGTTAINTSLQPILLTPADIDIDSSVSFAASHAFYMHLNHTWHRPNGPVPSIGIGAQIELGGSAARSEPCTNRPVINTALSQWILWIKGGIDFDA
jgi:hypothetical protein